jgi:transposase
MNSEANVTYVGIDAHKVHLVWQTPDLLVREANKPQAVYARLRELKQRYPKLHLIIEPSGGQERMLLAAAAALQLPATRVNARQVRDYARGLGWLEKSDSIDAKVLQQYGQTARPKPTQQPSAVQEKLRELVQLRDHYVEQLQHEQTYAQTLQTSVSQRIAQEHHAQLAATIEQVEKQIEALLETEAPELQLPIQTLCLVTGMGVRSAVSLLAYVPELGRLNDQAISKLVGVAPIVDESGLRFGNRHIKYGRAAARRILYLCALVAAQHNEYLKPFYQRLIAAGKPPKLALIAVARKLLRYLNRLLKPLYAEQV